MRPTQFIHVGLFGLGLTVFACGTGRGESLEDAWSVALAQNHRLAAAKMDEAAAVEDRGAATAERMPNLSLRSAYTVRSDEPSFVVRDPLPYNGARSKGYLVSRQPTGGT